MQAFWMVLASLMFAFMAISIKWASGTFTTFEIVFYRGLVSFILMYWVARSRSITLKTQYPWMHLWRGTIGVLSLSAWFFAIAHLPVATAMTLNYMSGVWVAVFVIAGSLMMGSASKTLSLGPVFLTVLMGFAGVVLMLKPTLQPNQIFAAVIGLFSGFGAGLAYIQVSALGKVGEPEDRTVFYFGLCTLIAGLIGMLLDGWHQSAIGNTSPHKIFLSYLQHWHTVHAWSIIPIGVFATAGQWCMTRAYSKGSTMVAASLQYLGIVFSALLGIILLNESLDALSWLGILIIVSSGMIATVLRNKTVATPAVEDR